MKTKCHVCNKRFDAVIKRKMDSEDIQDIYFVCPRCNEFYHIAYTNAEIRAYNEELQQVRNALLKDKQNKELFEKAREMMITHKSMMDKLNNKLGRVGKNG
jgi:hypothetical protein